MELQIGNCKLRWLIQESGSTENNEISQKGGLLKLKALAYKTDIALSLFAQ
ncbi:hypothetical protein ACVWYG_002818 [Pedobacter sp. UYEF25]